MTIMFSLRFYDALFVYNVIQTSWNYWSWGLTKSAKSSIIQDLLIEKKTWLIFLKNFMFGAAAVSPNFSQEL